MGPVGRVGRGFDPFTTSDHPRGAALTHASHRTPTPRTGPLRAGHGRSCEHELPRSSGGHRTQIGAPRTLHASVPERVIVRPARNIFKIGCRRRVRQPAWRSVGPTNAACAGNRVPLALRSAGPCRPTMVSGSLYRRSSAPARYDCENRL
jgi:hypothetical protein